VAALAANNTSGASELLREALDILTTARAAGVDMPDVARAVREAQPTMASLWNAAAAALSPDPERLNVFAQHVRRAPAALARYAAAHFADPDAGGFFRLKAEATKNQVRGFRLQAEDQQFRVITLSYSSSVVIVLKAIAATRRVHVSCSESRPALEGRQLATDLAAAGMAVTCYSDAAIADALDTADAVVVGADAVASSWFLNKAGTRMLAAVALYQSVPVYVVATRDKFVDDAVAGQLGERPVDPREVWDSPPEGVRVHNAYFEATPLDLVTSVISDIGVLGAGMVPAVCATSAALHG
jgi:translation initiation factor 2B subunit (eIF-2B alpha/beta/delta family)